MALIQDAINKNLEFENRNTNSGTNTEVQKKHYQKTETRTTYTSNGESHPINKADRILDDDIEYLKKLKELRDMEILSEEEYKIEKEKVLKKQG